MNVRWKTLMTKATVWLVAEILLGRLGLDDLADYGEYRFSATKVRPAHHVELIV